MHSALSVTYSEGGERGGRTVNIIDIDISDHINTSIADDGNVISCTAVDSVNDHSSLITAVDAEEWPTIDASKHDF